MTRLSTRVLFLLLCLFAAPVMAKPGTVLVLGDSLSAGYGIPRGQDWVSLLQQRLDGSDRAYHVINASITGDTTHGGLTRLPAALQRHQPEIVLLELGGNDGLRGLDLATTRANLRDMIHLARAAGARVLLLGLRLPANYGKVYADRFHAVYTELAVSENAALVDFFLKGVAETTELMQPDGIHPSAQAQPRILDNVWEGLEPLL